MTFRSVPGCRIEPIALGKTRASGSDLATRHRFPGASKEGLGGAQITALRVGGGRAHEGRKDEEEQRPLDELHRYASRHMTRAGVA